MTIIYNGTDITNSVRVRECSCVDASRDRADSLQISFENPSAWYRWQPETDDTIEIRDSGYTTGQMYISSVQPSDDYRIIAVSIPKKMREKSWESFEDLTIREIIKHFGDICGMETGLYGIDETIRIPYIIREMETGASFLSRVLMQEGCLLKCVNGRIAAIGIEWAQSRNALQTIQLEAGGAGYTYRKNSNMELSSLRVVTPAAEAIANDKSVSCDERKTVTDSPAPDAETAERWAKGLLLSNNRLSEEIEIQSDFNPGWTAAVRVDISGVNELAGRWMVDEVRHDFIERTSTAILVRCRTGVE